MDTILAVWGMVACACGVTGIGLYNDSKLMVLLGGFMAAFTIGYLMLIQF